MQIAAKPLEIKTWLLLIGYRNLTTPYTTVTSPIPYDVPFSNNTTRSRWQTTNRRRWTTHRSLYSKRNC